MKKVLFTLALGLFFVTFTNAQSTLSETAETKSELIVKNKACDPDCTKNSCDHKKAAKGTIKDKKSCATKEKSCADKKRPSSCKH
ncbi:MAG TPA: hypothetical protein EYG92_12060 [Lutibacter sp.]|nr:hypothetical protein [Lutibacter sp.]